jgi:hypothetical protein
MACLNLLELRKGDTGQAGQGFRRSIAHPPFVIRQPADEEGNIFGHADLPE